MEKIIQIKNLTKSFGKIKAVNGLSFSVRAGELFAFLGVNGAGKSTTINMMCSQLSPDAGEIIIDGCNIKDNAANIKSSLGVVFQSSLLDRALTVRDNLESRAALYGIIGENFEKRLLELSEILELGELLNRSIGKLSGGQRRRIDIARALIHKPKILILDEPTTGLDPQTRKMLWNVIESLRRTENMTVLLTTHYMEEAADADYVVIIDKGRIAAEGTPLELKNAYAGDFITLYGAKESEASALSDSYQKIGEAFRIKVESTADATKLILENPEMFVDYEITKGKMDDVFLAVTGRTIEEEERAGGK